MTTAHVYRGTGVALDRPHDWRDWAACRDEELELFFPLKTDDTEPARLICAGCTVRAECLQHALTFPERHGIWGGLSERQRKRLRAKKGQT